MFSKVIKVISLVLALVLMVSIMSACGSNSNVKVQNDGSGNDVNVGNNFSDNSNYIEDATMSDATKKYWEDLKASLQDWQLDTFENNKHYYCCNIEDSIVANYDLLDYEKLGKDFVLTNPLDLGEEHKKCIRQEDCITSIGDCLDSEKLLGEYIKRIEETLEFHEKKILTTEIWNDMRKLGWWAEGCMGNDDRFARAVYYSSLNMCDRHDIVIENGCFDNETYNWVKDCYEEMLKYKQHYLDFNEELLHQK